MGERACRQEHFTNLSNLLDFFFVGPKTGYRLLGPFSFISNAGVSIVTAVDDCYLASAV